MEMGMNKFDFLKGIDWVKAIFEIALLGLCLWLWMKFWIAIVLFF